MRLRETLGIMATAFSVPPKWEHGGHGKTGKWQEWLGERGEADGMWPEGR